MITRAPVGGRSASIALALLFWMASEAECGAGTVYVATDLGTLGGPTSLAFGINDAGDVVGSAATPTPSTSTYGFTCHADATFFTTVSHAFVHRAGAMVDLGTLGGEYGVARDVNASGDVVGFSQTAGNEEHAFLHTGGAIADLLPSYFQSGASAINQAGEIAGVYLGQRGFLYNGALTDIGTLGGSIALAFGLNDAGAVVGWSTGPGGSHAFLYSGGTMTDLTPVPGTSSVGYAINASGQVAANVEGSAALISGGTVTQIGTLGGPNSVALGLNDAGRVVGWSRVNAFVVHAFVYGEDGRLFDLNDLLLPGSGFELISATAVNNVGQIAGCGMVGGQMHAFRLDPVPTVCGDGAVDLDEECDAGSENGAPAGCCTADCQLVPDGTSCSDGTACTVGDACASGACAGGAPVDCGQCATCDPTDGCVAAPRTSCKQAMPRKSSLTFKDAVPDGGDLVIWKWSGDATTVAELANPFVQDDYALCVFSGADELVFRATTPAGSSCGSGPCWKPAGATGLKYASRDGLPDGTTKLLAKAGGDGRAKASLKGKGGHLSARPFGLPALPLALPLRAQLQIENGACFDATYDAATRNDGSVFRAKSD